MSQINWFEPRLEAGCLLFQRSRYSTDGVAVYATAFWTLGIGGNPALLGHRLRLSFHGQRCTLS
jgi:hypothetical protein